MEVLFEYQGLRSIVKCKRSKILESIGSELSEEISATLPHTSALESAVEVHTLQSSRRARVKRGGRRPKPGIRYYLLQRYVKDWKAFINVDNTDQLKNRDTLTVVELVDEGVSTLPPLSISTANPKPKTELKTEAKVAYCSLLPGMGA